MSSTHYPSHWTKSALGQIVIDIEAGKSFRCIEKPPTDDWPGIVKVSAVSWGSFNEHESKTCPDEKLFDPRYQIRPGDFLMSRANTVELVGACVIVGSISKRLMLSDKILRILFADDLKAWTLWYLRSKEGRAQIEARATGNQLSMRNIGQARILEIEIPLPPDRERLIIVEAIESYLTRLDDAMTTLERVHRNLKRYRASVLKAAVEGRLVPTEAKLAREEDREYEPASVLLERILAERRRRWEEAELAKLKAKGKAPKNDKWKAKYVEPAGPVTSELPDLPEGWCWATIEQVSSLVTDGDHNPPKRTDEGVPHLTAKSVKGLTLTLDGCSFLSAEGFEKTRSRYEPIEGDLIVTCVGTVGECAIVPPGLVFSADRNLAAVRLLPHGAVAKYVLYTLISPEAQRKLRGASGSTAQPHLYLKDLRALALPLPPKDEQFRIVYEVETLLSNERFSSDVVSASLIRNDRLRQSVLKWAFEGRLVGQDLSDEPAEVLLERIRTERAASQGKKQSCTRRVNSRSATA